MKNYLLTDFKRFLLFTVTGTFLVGLLLPLFFAQASSASVFASGDLDPSFGSGGKVTTAVGNGRSYAQAAALQTDGKLVIIGNAQDGFAVVRYNADGTLDTGFGTGGKVLTALGINGAEAYDVAVQTDGRILVVGLSRPSTSDSSFAVVRYNPNGTLDTGFGNGGIVLTAVETGVNYAEAVIVQPDGKIIAAGTSGSQKYAIVRYNADGSLDSSFGVSGKTIFQVSTSGGNARAAALQTDGKILVGGSSGVDTGQTTYFKLTLTRFNSNGNPDASFGTSGKVVTSISSNSYGTISDIVIQSDGKIIATGGNNTSSAGDTAVIRYNTDGTLDSGFGTGGIVTTRVGTVYSTGEALLLQTNGKIVVAGDSYGGQFTDFGTVRLNANGSLDTSFGTSGKVITSIDTRNDSVRDAVLQPNGKIVVIGYSQNSTAGFNEYFAAARYLGDAVTTTAAPFDFDGDAKTDLAIFRPAPGEWWYLRSSNGTNYAAQFGASTDRITPADFTGDGRTDIAFFRPSTGQWFILRSEDQSFYAFPFGMAGDIPAPSDYDGDGKADAAVFRPSNQTWFIQKSSGGTTIQQFGISGDIPVASDYDGDGKTDIAIFRPSAGEWWIQRSSNNSVFAVQFGNGTDKPLPGKYTGDNKADVAFFRPSTGEWFILRSEDFSFYAAPFGTSGDIPAPGDYDGDGRNDPAVFRPSNSTWFVQRSTAGTLIQAFGIAGDAPVPSAFVP